MTESEWLASEDANAMLTWARSQNVDPSHKVAQCEAYRRLSDRVSRLFACAASMAFGGHDRRQDPIVAEHADTVARAEAWADMGERGEVKASDAMWHAMDVPALDAAVGIVRSIDATNRGRGAGVAALLRDIVGNPFRPIPYVWLNEQLYPRPERERLIGDDISDLTPVSWLTPQVLSLAQAAYEEQQENGTLDPFRLLLLADALEDAGCSCVDCRTCGGAGVITQDHPFGDTWATETLGCPHCEGGGREQHPLLTHLRSPGPHYRGCHVVDTLLGKA